MVSCPQKSQKDIWSNKKRHRGREWSDGWYEECAQTNWFLDVLGAFVGRGPNFPPPEHARAHCKWSWLSTGHLHGSVHARHTPSPIHTEDGTQRVCAFQESLFPGAFTGVAWWWVACRRALWTAKWQAYWGLPQPGPHRLLNSSTGIVLLEQCFMSESSMSWLMLQRSKGERSYEKHCFINLSWET